MSVLGKWRFISNFLLLLTLLASCSSKKATEAVTEELQNVSSWAATAHVVGDAWIRNAIPSSYAQQTLKKTESELQQTTDKLSKLSTSPTQQRSLMSLQQLKYTVSQMSTAVENKDRSALITQLKQLSTQEQTIHELAKPTGEKP